MPIFQKGSINTTALIVPDLYVQVVPPAVSLLNGVATNILGVVGTASWGPVGAPVIISNMADYAKAFGPVMARKFDLGTGIAAAVLQGANNMRAVRVTDGTDLAATIDVKDTAGSPLTGVTITSKYTGSYGNKITVNAYAGSQADTFKFVIAIPGGIPEVYDNISGVGAAFWANVVNAINNGLNGVRGPSELVVASIGTSVTNTPNTSTTYTCAGGADGVTTITSTVLVGVDTVPRKGMYALRNTKCSVAFLADADDTTQWSLQDAFGLSEGIYMILTGPAGQTVTTAATAKASAGVDSYSSKVMMGDWAYFQDTVNNQLRLISPQGFVAGRLANLSPEQSTLNKPIRGIVGTQSTMNSKGYSSAELGVLATAGIDVITNPVPGGNYFGCRIGHNSSSDPTINGDNYTRMTNYIASTLDAGMGRFIGRLQTPDERSEAKATIDSFLAAMQQQGMIGSASGGPAFQTILDNSNNPPARVALGYQQCDVKVIYLSVVEKFIINVEGGTSVSITKASA